PFFSLICYCTLLYLHSFPTRRSSDLVVPCVLFQELQEFLLAIPLFDLNELYTISVFLWYFKEENRETQIVCPGCLACYVDGATGGMWREFLDNNRWRQNSNYFVDTLCWQRIGDEY